MVLTIWLVGGVGPDSGMAMIHQALVDAGARVVIVNTDAIPAFKESIDGSQLLAEPPQLVILAGDIARADDAALIRALRGAGRWQATPIVVLDEQRGGDDSLYHLGISSNAVVPAGERALAEKFAHYWTQTILLPSL